MQGCKRKLLVVAETDAHCGRQLIRGVAAYVRPEKDWIIRAFHNQRPVQWMLENFQPDAVIFHDPGPDSALGRVAWGVPAVQVIEEPDELAGVPLVVMDDVQTGRMAAEYLLRQGFRNFAFIGCHGRAYSRRRLEGFNARLRQEGLDCAEFMLSGFHGLIPRDLPFDPEPEFSGWLRALPVPCALFVCNDGNAYGAVEHCNRLQIQVPDELAVLGVDNDDLLCLTASPPVSSIRMPFGAMGYESARTVERMLEMPGISVPPVVRFGPAEVCVRRSTDALAVQDALVARALRLVGEWIERPFKVGELAAELGVSRTLLEQRFNRVLHGSPLMEIRRRRIARARKLLAETGMTAGEVARCCGFAGPERFASVFKELTGLTATEYRSRFQTATAFDPSDRKTLL